jgi:hypothetical protein
VGAAYASTGAYASIGAYSSSLAAATSSSNTFEFSTPTTAISPSTSRNISSSESARTPGHHLSDFSAGFSASATTRLLPLATPKVTLAETLLLHLKNAELDTALFTTADEPTVFTWAMETNYMVATLLVAFVAGSEPSDRNENDRS